MSELLILKIGGSVITEKERTDYTVRTDLLHEIFKSIKTALCEKSEMKLILIHGAGGHIHHLAKEYGLRESCIGDVERTKGALHTQLVTKHLNNDVTTIAQEMDVALFPIQTTAVIQNSDGKISSFTTDTLNNALTQNLIPVLYGDMVIDSTRGFSICSGDTIVAYLAAVLPVQRVLFASDIGGIFTNDPHIHKDAELLEDISIRDIESGKIELSESHNVDMSDGLRGKLNECKGLFSKAAALETIEIFNGLQAKNVEKALLGEQFPHTYIKK